MAPGKRGRPPAAAGVIAAAAAASSAVPEPSEASDRKAKRARLGEIPVIRGGTRSSTRATTQSGRPRRQMAGEMNPKATRDRVPNGSSVASQIDATRSMGRERVSSRTNMKKKTNTTTTSTASTGRGRLPSTATAASKYEQKDAGPAKRGRPKSIKRATDVSGDAKKDMSAIKRGRTFKASRGRPKKASITVAGRKLKASKPSSKATAASEASSTLEDQAEEKDEAEATESDCQYWLMKAEPESRIENGVDVKFSIDDLKAKVEPEAWDGVRNHSARNNMRAMRAGDLAFFYHSNCKVPGIAGVLKIVKEHSVDESAFNPKHPYYDPKSSRDKPRWDVVHVQFVHKFPQLVKLSDLRSHAISGEPLEDMQMLRLSRLSVSAVRPKEWAFILRLAGLDTTELEEDNWEMRNNAESTQRGVHEIDADASGAIHDRDTASMSGHGDAAVIEHSQKISSPQLANSGLASLGGEAREENAEKMVKDTSTLTNGAILTEADRPDF